MGLGQGQQGQTPAQGIAERDLTGHGLIGQAGDLGADVGSVWTAFQGDVGQGLERLDADKGGIEIEDQRGGVGHDGLTTPSFAVAATRIAAGRA